MPFGYVSPEQVMKDRADYARKGIARGRAVLVMTYADGILFVAENPSSALHKISEIYDRIGFAAVVGVTAEVGHPDPRDPQVLELVVLADRRDVTGRALANTYAQILGTIFSSGGEKPFEVEITVAEVGHEPDGDQLYRLTYDGSVADETGVVVMGGSAEPIGVTLREGHRHDIPLAEGLQLAVGAIASSDGETREIAPAQLEVAVLDRSRTRRTFRRLPDTELSTLLSS
jgi:proteasome alpha subunit